MNYQNLRMIEEVLKSWDETQFHSRLQEATRVKKSNKNLRSSYSYKSDTRGVQGVPNE